MGYGVWGMGFYVFLIKLLKNTRTESPEARSFYYLCSRMNNKSRLLLFISLLLTATVMFGQRHEIYNDRIHTLQVMVDDEWMEMPVMKLNGDNRLYITFDDLTHTYHRYIYKIEHCEADWSKSESIFQSDYMNGYDGNPIEDEAVQSLNTTVLYSNYCITIPNENCSLKMSGNYRLTVYDDDNHQEKILSACFMVVEPLMSVALSASSNTDIDVNRTHQQVDMTVGFGNVNITDPENQIHTVVMQNGRWDTAVEGVAPNYRQRDRLVWTHNRNFIFEGGNEYCKFEMFDVHRLTMNIDYRRNIEEYYHTFLFPIDERRHYVYDEDADGAFLIRNGDDIESNMCDYEFVHYKIKSPIQAPGKVYLNGKWTYDQFTDDYLMEYNLREQCYEATILQKQGYYNYQVVYLDSKGKAHPLPSQGNFFETENKYQALVYYKGNADRTWRLVGYQNVVFKP